MTVSKLSQLSNRNRPGEQTRSVCLSENIRRQLRFQKCNLIFKKEFALLNAPQMQFVMPRRVCENADGQVKVVMLELKFVDTALYCFRV